MNRLLGWSAIFLGAACGLGAHAAPAARKLPRTTRQMRCREVQEQVNRTGRYYNDSFDGPIPIYGIKPTNVAPVCEVHQDLIYLREPTRDNPLCLVAFFCGAN